MNYFRVLPAKNKFFLGIFILLLISIPITVIVVSKSELLESRSRADLSGDIRILSKQLLTDQGNESDKISASQKRKDLMKQLAKSDPESYLLNVVSEEIKSTLPTLAQENIESKTEITGTIIENVAETEEGSTMEPLPPFSIQALDNQGFVTKSYLLHLREGMNIAQGQTAKITGYEIDNVLVPIKIEILSTPASFDPETTVTGEDVLGVSTTGSNKKIAVLMVNFKSDKSDTSGGFTREELEEIYFSGTPSTVKYLKNASFNQINFQGDINDVYGWITIPNFTRAQACDINETGDGIGFKKAAIDKARAQATARGINFDDYEFIGFIFPYSTVCSWDSAIASGVGNVDSNAKPHHFLNGDYCAHSSNCSSKDKRFYSALMAHEMGHNLGLSHANGLDCGSKIVDTYANCKSITYADRFDLIGGAWTYLPYVGSANQVIRLGWIPPENRRNVNENTINSTGNYTLHSTSIKKDPGNIQFIKIPRTVDGGAYYLEYRTKNGLDSDIPDALPKGLIMRLSEIPNGVLKNESGDLQYRPQQTYLLDLSNSDPASWADFLNPSLRDGKSFEDTRNKIKVTQLSHDEAAGTVNLKIELGPPPCEKLDPGLIAAEPSLSGTAGEKVRYTFTITNNNSPTCASAIYNISATSPSGWTATLGRSTASLNSGSQTSFILDVTSASNATTSNNPYATQVTVADSTNSTYARSRQINYSIEIPTKNPTPIPSNTPTPISIPESNNSTITSVPGETVLRFPKIKLHGIGTGGDNTNPSSQGNQTPQTLTRNLTVEILDSTGASVANVTSSIGYNASTGTFSGDITLPSTLASTGYLVKIKTDKYLRKQLKGIITINKGQINTIPEIEEISLTAGDSNKDNKLDISDFNIISDCYSDLLDPKNCNDQSKKIMADLTDDGKVNQNDYNLFLRELSVKQGD